MVKFAKQSGQVLVGVTFLVMMMTGLAVLILDRSISQVGLVSDLRFFLNSKRASISCLEEGAYRLLRSPGYSGGQLEWDGEGSCQVEVFGAWPEKNLSCECRVRDKVFSKMVQIRLVDGLIDMSY